MEHYIWAILAERSAVAIGTRCDFYIGRGVKAEWLGSIAWDGNPESVLGEKKHDLGECKTDKEWRDRVGNFLREREDATLPERGWPWPWEDSGTTDYAYAFDRNAVYVSRFGEAWLIWKAWQARGATPNEWDEYDRRQAVFDEGKADEAPLKPSVPRPKDLKKTAKFPDMTDKKNVRFDKGSGLIFFQAGKEKK